MKNAIKLATESGWSLDLSQVDHYDGVPCDKGFLLDPLFYQALGKVRPNTAEGNGHIVLSSPVGYALDKDIDFAQYTMHRLVDHLIEGGSPDSYFSNLLKDK